MTVFEKIIHLLEGVEYVVKEHAPTPTSADSARERGEALNIGAKALVVKAEDEFALVVVPANKRLSSSKVRKFLGRRKLRFASKEELLSLTGLVPGAVPPFGSVLGLRMLVDETLFEEKFMAFNAGDLRKSVKMKTTDYRRLEVFEVGVFVE